MSETSTSEGVRRIAAERQRQIEEEGWTAEHDSEHTLGEMAIAAACYASITASPDFEGYVANPYISGRLPPPEAWPWSRKWWKPSADPIRNLAKAGALIAAEIDRLERSVHNPKEAKDE